MARHTGSVSNRTFLLYRPPTFRMIIPIIQQYEMLHMDWRAINHLTIASNGKTIVGSTESVQKLLYRIRILRACFIYNEKCVNVFAYSFSQIHLFRFPLLQLHIQYEVEWINLLIHFSHSTISFSFFLQLHIQYKVESIHLLIHFHAFT